jgi:hypothetical protein
VQENRLRGGCNRPQGAGLIPESSRPSGIYSKAKNRSAVYPPQRIACRQGSTQTTNSYRMVSYMTYTVTEIKAQLSSLYGSKIKFLLNLMGGWGFTLEGASFLKSKTIPVNSKTIRIRDSAPSLAIAADWAMDSLREWAYWNSGPRGDASNWFGWATRRWAMEGDGRNNTAYSLGSTLDWLYLFSKATSTCPSKQMYPVLGNPGDNSDHPEIDLFALFCWAFADKWSAVDTTRTHAKVNIQSTLGLNILFQEPSGDDQTHHFAGYFFFGARFGDGENWVLTALTRTGDAKLSGSPPKIAITRPPDAYLGLLAAQWGADMASCPRYIGKEVSNSLIGNCNWPVIPSRSSFPLAGRSCASPPPPRTCKPMATATQ